MKKVLPDENLPVKLKYCLQDVCEIYTVKDKGRECFGKWPADYCHGRRLF